MPYVSKPFVRSIWTVTEKTELVFDTDFITSNTIDMEVNGVPITQVPFNTDHDTTIEDLRAEIQSSSYVSTAVLTDIGGVNRTIEITPVGADRVILSAILVDGGATQTGARVNGIVDDNDVASPESGQLNTDDPPKAVKTLGWDFKQFPPRQWWNWWKRVESKWFGWLDQELKSGSFQIGFYGTGFTPGSYTTGTAYWFKHNGAVTLMIPYLSGTYTVDTGMGIGPIPSELRVKEPDIVLQPEVLLAVSSPSAGAQIGAMKLTENASWPIDPQAPYSGPSGWGTGTRTIQPTVITYWPNFNDPRA